MLYFESISLLPLYFYWGLGFLRYSEAQWKQLQAVDHLKLRTGCWEPNLDNVWHWLAQKYILGGLKSAYKKVGIKSAEMNFTWWLLFPPQYYMLYQFCIIIIFPLFFLVSIIALTCLLPFLTLLFSFFFNYFTFSSFYLFIIFLFLLIFFTLFLLFTLIIFLSLFPFQNLFSTPFLF